MIQSSVKKRIKDIGCWNTTELKLKSFYTSDCQVVPRSVHLLWICFYLDLFLLRSVNQRKYTGIDSVCCYRKAATAPPFDPINIYQKFINETNHFTKMGRYNLDPNSLFVNGKKHNFAFMTKNVWGCSALN